MKQLFTIITFIFLAQPANAQVVVTDFELIQERTEYVCQYSSEDELELYDRPEERDGTWQRADFNNELNTFRSRKNASAKRYRKRKRQFGLATRKTRKAKRVWIQNRKIFRELRACPVPITAASVINPCDVIAPPSPFFNVRIINGSSCRQLNSSVVEIKALKVSSSGSCSGTVLNPTTVLTAAHCLPETTKRVRVITGQESVFAESFEAHPLYNSQESQSIESFDVGIIKLTDPLFAPSSQLLTGTPITGESSIIAGFGLDENENAGSLKAAQIPITFVDFDTIATRFTKKLSQGNTCFGDSGGPLFVSRKGEWRIAGITSNGDLQSCGLGDTSRYANINNPAIRTFIEERLE